MEYSFSCKGHKNILALHRNTIEFTKEKEISLQGDCIIGTCADFDLELLIDFVRQNRDKTVEAEIKTGELRQTFNFFFNRDFLDEHEIVIRKTDFLSKRTLGIKADVAAQDIDRDFARELRNGETKIEVIFRT